MKLKSFNYIISLLIIFLFTPIQGEEKIDIWNNKKETPSKSLKSEEAINEEKSNLKSSQTIQATEKIEIEEGTAIKSDEKKVYGIYDPADYDFSLNMWSATKAEDLRSSLKRLNKIELSKSSNEIFQMILFSFSYPPQGMKEKEFVDLKINWLIKNDKIPLIEEFLKQNEEFESKARQFNIWLIKILLEEILKKGVKK